MHWVLYIAASISLVWFYYFWLTPRVVGPFNSLALGWRVAIFAAVIVAAAIALWRERDKLKENYRKMNPASLWGPLVLFAVAMLALLLLAGYVLLVAWLLGLAAAVWLFVLGWRERAATKAAERQRAISNAQNLPIVGACPRCGKFRFARGTDDLLVCDCGYSFSARTLIVGSAVTRVYHRPTCRETQGTKKVETVLFGATWDATLHGHHPCAECEPPPVYRHFG